MLSAQKDNQRIREICESGELSSFRSFTKITDSIQGLRELLEKVTLDEIIAAEEKARTLIHRLSLLERALGSIYEISRCLATVGATAEDVNAKASGLATGTGAPRKHPHVHQTHQPNNLIVFPVGHRASRESPEPTTFENKTRYQPALEEPGRRRAASNTDESIEDSVHAGAKRTTSATNDEVHVQTGSGKRAEQSVGPSNDPSDWTIDKAPQSLRVNSPHLGSPVADAVVSLRAHDAGVSQEIIDSLTDGDTWKIGDEPSRGASTSKDIRQPREPEAFSIEFDQELLDDLIKDYGEFTTYVKLSGTVDPTTRPPNNGPVDSTRPNDSHDELRATVVRRQKTDVDLDRKLKKLIQDYGEYDLYSHRNSANAKKGAVAFVLLALILSGLYYFYSVPTPMSGKPGVAVQLDAASSTAESIRNTHSREDQKETVNGSDSSAADFTSEVVVSESTK